MVRSFIVVCWVGWEQLWEIVWYLAGIRNLGDCGGMVTGGGTEIKVPIPSHFDGNTIPTHYHVKPCKIRLLWRTRRCLTATYTGVTSSHEKHVCGAAATVPTCFLDVA